MLEFEDLPRSLQKVLAVWVEPENWGITLKEACEKAGVKYGTARNAIMNVGSADFYELKARLVDRMLSKHHDEIMKALTRKAKSGNTRAIELYLKATSRLVERLEVNGSIQVNLVADRLNEIKSKLDALESSSSEDSNKL